MTPGGALLLRVRDRVVPVHPTMQRIWREYRAENLARMIARHRLTEHPLGCWHLRRIILDDIVPDIGWPRARWLRRRVRHYEREIRALRAEWHGQSVNQSGDTHG